MDNQSLAQIANALESVHSASTSSDERRKAQELLESLKQREDSAWIGWSLAAPDKTGILRHFGLGLLQNAIQYQLTSFTEEKRLTLRTWVVQLAMQVQDSDPYYVREKLAYLWVSIAKRVWGLDTRTDTRSDDVAPADGWIDMDASLLNLWNLSSAGRELSLSILRTLFEDLYLLDDPVAAKRSGILSAQCIEIVTPVADLQAIYDARSPSLQRIRVDDEGWLPKWVKMVKDCFEVQDSESSRYLIKTLETLKSCLYWVCARSIRTTDLLPTLTAAMKHPNLRVRILACDNLHVLFTRNYNQRQDFNSIIGEVMKPEGIQWLAGVYDKLSMDPSEEDEYVFSKKLIEMIVGLGDYLDSPKFPLETNIDSDGYFRLLLKISQHPSLMASGISLQFWCSILRHDEILGKYKVEKFLPDLLKVASERCIRYENMPETHLSHLYMAIDFDSSPEAQQFFGSYRRYMEDVIRLIVCHKPLEALTWLHEGMTGFFQTQEGWQVMNKTPLGPNEPAFILGCGQLAIVESALRGVSRWEIWRPAEEREKDEKQVMAMLLEWNEQMLHLEVRDTTMHARIIECLVQFAPLLKSENKVMFSILERVLKACTYEYPPEDGEHDEERERVKELRNSSGTELNRLAYMVPESLMQVYDDLENVISNLLGSGKVREHESVSFKSFLLVVSQRSSLPNKSEKFQLIVDPVLQSWTDESTMQGLMDLEWFMERVGVVRIAEYFKSRGLFGPKLLEAPMDDAGRALKLELKSKWQAIFPIRPTRIFIQYSIERLERTSPEYLHLLSMWKPRVQPILPHILQLIYQIFAYHNPANWTNLPLEVQEFVKVSCTERFWQVGVSMQTKDEFENQTLEASKTLRDFADSVGHIVRYTREYAFLTLGSITQLEETMFEIEGMGELLFRALAGETAGITSHCWRHMISLVVRNVVKNCPIKFMPTFLVDFMPPLLRTIDQVLVAKWEKQSQDGFQLMEGENIDESDADLSDEMMDEHLLRQLTAIVDRLLIDLVGQVGVKSEQTERKQALRELCTTNNNMLFSILSLCRHIMLFKDGRCCFNTCLIVRNLLIPSLLEREDVAAYFCDEIIPACLGILSDPYLHESHYESGAILTTIYMLLRANSNMPLAKLQSLLPETPVVAFEELEETLLTARTHKQQRGIMLDFLTTWQVLRNDEETRSRTQKRVEHRVSRRHEPQDAYDSAAVISMFGGAP